MLINRNKKNVSTAANLNHNNNITAESKKLFELCNIAALNFCLLPHQFQAAKLTSLSSIIIISTQLILPPTTNKGIKRAITF